MTHWTGPCAAWPYTLLLDLLLLLAGLAVSAVLVGKPRTVRRLARLSRLSRLTSTLRSSRSLNRRAVQFSS